MSVKLSPNQVNHFSPVIKLTLLNSPQKVKPNFEVINNDWVNWLELSIFEYVRWFEFQQYILSILTSSSVDSKGAIAHTDLAGY